MSCSGAAVHRHALEERRLAHVGRVAVPRETAALGNRQALPPRVAAEHVAVATAEHVGGHGLEHRLLQLVLGRPDVFQIDRPSRRVVAERLGRDVRRDPSRQRVGDDQWRRGEVVGANVLLNPAFEVAVAAQHRADHKVLLAHGRGDLLRQRTAVPDARRAAVADKIEPELIEIGGQARGVEILGHDFRTGCQAALHPRLARETALDRLLGDEARPDHDARIRRVRAAGDGGDHHRAVIERSDRRLRQCNGRLRGSARASGSFRRHLHRRQRRLKRRLRVGQRRRGPAAAWARRGWARSTTGSARSPPNRWHRDSPASGRVPAPSRTARPAPPATPRVLSGAGSRASCDRSGKWPRWRRTRDTCFRASRGRRSSARSGPRRRTRRTCRRRRACAGSR